jgi:hypothetical protein
LITLGLLDRKKSQGQPEAECGQSPAIVTRQADGMRLGERPSLTRKTIVVGCFGRSRIHTATWRRINTGF